MSRTQPPSTSGQTATVSGDSSGHDPSTPAGAFPSSHHDSGEARSNPGEARSNPDEAQSSISDATDPRAERLKPEIPGLTVLEEFVQEHHQVSYRARRYGADYLLTMVELDRADPIGQLRGLRRDAAAVARAGDRRLPAVRQVGSVDGQPFVVTELVTGRSLTEVIAGDPISVVGALRLVLDVLEPLTAMHRQGLSHRGISSTKLVITASGVTRLLDAGLGNERLLLGRSTSQPLAVDQLDELPNELGGGSSVGLRSGGLGHLAPEQSGAIKRPVDDRTDLYSLGVVLFECLTGTLPFLATDLASLRRLHADQVAPDLRRQAGDLPECLADIVSTLLAVEPDERYQDGAALATDLRRLLVALETAQLTGPVSGRSSGHAGHSLPDSSPGPVWSAPNAPGPDTHEPGTHKPSTHEPGANGSELGLRELGLLEPALLEPAPLAPTPHTPTPNTPAPHTPAPHTPAPDTPVSHTASTLTAGIGDQEHRDSTVLGPIAEVAESAFAVRDHGPLIGRDHELALLDELWEQVRRGRGRGCALRGASGTGKTRLSSEMARLARQNGAPVLTLRCLADDPLPFGPIRRAVQTLLLEADSLPEHERGLLRERVRAAAEPSAALLAGLCPALSTLLSTTSTVGVDHDQEDQFAAAVAQFIVDLGRVSGGLMLITDDGDLIDAWTLRVLSHLSTQLADTPVLSLGVARLDRQAPCTTDPLMQSIYAAIDLDLVLEPLGRPAVDELLGQWLPGLDPESAPAQVLRDLGGGNPLLLREHLDRLSDAGDLRPHWGSWQLSESTPPDPAHHTPAPDEPAPDEATAHDSEVVAASHDPNSTAPMLTPEQTQQAVQSLLLTRFNALAPGTRRALRVAALTGPRFHPDIVIAAAALDPVATRFGLAEAARGRLIELESEGWYRFSHERVREMLHGGTNPKELAAIHLALAEVLQRQVNSHCLLLADVGEPPRPVSSAPASQRAHQILRVAQHYLLGTQSGQGDRAFEICRMAGLLAMSMHAPARAVTLLGHADRLRPGDARLLYALGTALHRDGRQPEAHRRLDEALVAEKDGLRRARILLRLTEVHRATRNIAKATSMVSWGLAELDAALPDSRPGRGLAALWSALVAALITVTGIGFGGVRHRARERQELLAALHLTGSYLATANLRPATLLMHRSLGARAEARLGPGRHYVLGRAASGVTAALFGLDRRRRRHLELAERGAAELADPQLVAEVAWYAGAADYLGRVDNGERWIRCLTDHLAWLDTDQYADAIAVLCWDAATRGRSDDVARWAENARNQNAFRHSAQLNFLLTVTPVLLSAAGRPVAAKAELRRIREQIALTGGRSLQLNLILAELYGLLEQDSYGEPFETALQRFASLGLSRTALSRPYRSFYALQARGRLGVCRAAADLPYPERTVDLAAARAAIRELGRMADTPLLRTTHQQCRAELLVLQGRPKQALRVLSRLQPLAEDAPLLGFEIARTTARALSAAGFPGTARNQVLTGLTTAANLGWTGRGRRLAAEFGLRPENTRYHLDPGWADDIGAPTTTAPNSATPNSTAIATARATPTDALTTKLESAFSPASREFELAVVLRESLAEMSGCADPTQVLRLLNTAAPRILPADGSWVIRPAPQMLTSPGRDKDGTSRPGQVLFAQLPTSGSVCDLVFDPQLRRLADSGQPLVGGPDTPIAPQLRRLLAASPSWAVLPLSPGSGAADGQPTAGVLVLTSTRTGAYDPTQLAVAQTLITQAMTAHAKAELMVEIQQLNGTDELTGVRSMRQVTELATRDLHSAQRSARPLVAMVIDIDHLGRINALYGRTTGDDVLRQVALRLGEVIRTTDLLGRYRSDEFVVVLSQGRDDEDGIGDGGHEVAERLLTAVTAEAIHTRSGRLPVTVTIGLTLLEEDDTELSDLTARAEVAVREAKQDGRGRVRGR